MSGRAEWKAALLSVNLRAAHRQDVRAFFSPRAAKIEGAARPLAQTLESLDRCIPLSGEQRAGVARFLEKS